MRNVKVGAIQTENLPIPKYYESFLGCSENLPKEIFDNHLINQINITLNLLEKAGQKGCGIVTTCENITGTAAYYNMDTSGSPFFSELLDISYPVLEAKLSEISKKYGMYIIACYNKRIENNNYNIASIFDRSGEICGEYRKTHLPSNEKWQVQAGNSIDVFKLDFGTIGICTCYDIMFPEVIRVQALKGAEIIFHPTSGYGWYDAIGEATLRTRANDNGVYLVTSKDYQFNHAGNSSIIDFWGQVTVDAGFYKNVIISGEIDLDIKKTQPNGYNPSQMSGIADVKKRMFRERRPELYASICETLQEKIRTPSKEEQKDIMGRIKSGKCWW